MLTAEQKKDIEESAWVVNAVLKRLGLSKDADMRQTAYLYLCESRQRYSPDHNTKWTTYAYKNVYLRVRKEQRRQHAYDERFVSDTDFLFDCEVDDEIKGIDDRQMIDCASAHFTEREKKVVSMQAQKYTLKEIGSEIGFSTTTVQNTIASARKKAKDACHENR